MAVGCPVIEKCRVYLFFSIYVWLLDSQLERHGELIVFLYQYGCFISRDREMEN